MAQLDEVILLSSDDEFESPPPKKLKPNIANSKTFAVFKQLNKLKEISAAPCEDNNVSIKNNHTEVNSITIIIEGDDKSKENENVVNVIDECLDEPTPSELKNNNDISASSNCLMVCSGSETEENPETPDLDSSIQSTKEPQDSGSTDPNETRENDNVPIPESEGILNRPSTSRASEAHTLLDEFVDTCTRSIRGSKYENSICSRFAKLRKNFNDCKNIHEDQCFKTLLREQTINAKISAPQGVLGFQKIHDHLKDNMNGISVDVDERTLRKLRKMDKALKLIGKKIKKLEETEVDFDDENSTYVQLDRYGRRYVAIYNKRCELLKMNPHAGRLMYQKVHFVHSNYNEINRAISKEFKSGLFPTYYDMEKCIRKCVTKHELSLSEAEIKSESRSCFEKLGRLLQARRKKDLYDAHSSYITLSEDPATKDSEMKAKLEQNKKQHEKTESDLLAKYSNMQENNVQVEISEDSDDSHYKDSDSDGP